MTKTHSRGSRTSCTRLFVFSVCLLSFCLLSFASSAAGDPRDVEVHTRLDKTAVWVADRITYAITITCRKGVDILADDLSKDKLRVEGFEIVGSGSDRAVDRDDRTTYTFTYELTTYRVDLPELTIAPLAVRYAVRRPGQRLEDAAPAGEVQVPGAVVAFRSALPDGQATYAIRDERAARPRRLRYAWLQPAGIALVVIAIVPAVVAVGAAIRRSRPREKPRSARQVRRDERASLAALQAIDLSAPAARREAFARLNSLVRDHLHDVAGVDAAALTPAEVDAALARSEERGRRVPREVATTVLEACDAARYAPPDALPSVDACRRAIEQCEHMLDGA